ncbi:MAG: hypothetical protein U0694_19690 [Anaerolineae bacterium]
MSVEVMWDNAEQSILRFVFEGKWSWEELYPALNEAFEMEKSVPHRVHAILDMRKSVSVPTDVLMHVKNISDQQLEKSGLSVIVTHNSFIHMLYQVGVKFYSKIDYYFRVAATMDEARAMIERAIARDSLDKTAPKRHVLR